MAKRRRNYVNNPDFYEAIKKYLKECDEAESAGEEIPVVPDYIGDCFMEIAKRLSTKPNFSGYPYREDMIYDGIENCLKYVRTFNPERTQNPFAYFTTTIYRAFIRRIQVERKQLYIKFKASRSVPLDLNGSEMGAISEAPDTDFVDNFIKDFEAKLDSK